MQLYRPILANLYKTFFRTSYFLLQDNAVFLRDMIISLVPRLESRRSENAHAFVRGPGPGAKLQRCASGKVRADRRRGRRIRLTPPPFPGVLYEHILIARENDLNAGHLLVLRDCWAVYKNAGQSVVCGTVGKY